ncbi:hypothetical protein CI610_01937 [invertebrate metagenome]|uniref:Peptidase C14 caspase domain-containing protein n=1 Tax=invertebrate metagenome TaxID=1711999 RepID=A0A2H9T7A4_9ZZZZ
MSYLYRPVTGFLCSAFYYFLGTSVCLAGFLMESTNKDQTGILLIGQNYQASEYPNLGGCINDTENLETFLTSTKGFPEENVKTMTDSRHKIITASAIKDAIRDMAKSTQENAASRKKIIFISYSGHGTQRAAPGYKESDGKDECLVAGDGFVSDNELHTLLKEFHPESKVFFLIDACHSGTMLDLKYRYRFKPGAPGNVSTKEMKSAVTDISAHIVCLSGCQDEQTSSDAYLEDKTEDSKMWERQGACTQAFIEHCKNFPLASLLNLPLQLKDTMVEGRFQQRPTLSSNRSLAYEDQLFDY